MPRIPEHRGLQSELSESLRSLQSALSANQHPRLSTRSQATDQAPHRWVALTRAAVGAACGIRTRVTALRVASRQRPFVLRRQLPVLTPCRQSPASASRRPNQLLCLARFLHLLPANGKCRNRRAIADKPLPELAHWLPTVWQQVERDRVAICELIDFQCLNRSQHVPDSVIVEHITLARLTHIKAT